MGSVAERLKRHLRTPRPTVVDLRGELARIRREKAEGKRTRNVTALPWHRIGKSEFVTINGETRERPQTYGLLWLALFGEALCRHGVAWHSRVNSERWENDGCVSLYLQRVLHSNRPAQRVSLVAGSKTPEVVQVPIGGGAWECFRIPVGAVNSHDTAWVLRKVMTPREADIVMASSAHLRAMHGK